MNKLFWKNRRVLVTGHTGFKGAWLSLWLQMLNSTVCGIALAPSTEPNLFSLLRAEKKMQHHIADVRDFARIQKITHEFQPEIIIHMAAQPLVRYSYEHPIETYETNVMGTVHILEAAKHCDSVRSIVNVTTDKCYENREWIWGYRENEPMGGNDPYSSSKTCSELVTSAYRNSFYEKANKGLATARAGNVIGGGDWSQDRLIVDIMKNIAVNNPVIIRNPEAIRPWQHVLEPLSGYLLLAEKLFEQPKKFNEAWNFGPNTNDVATVDTVVKKLFLNWTKKNAGWEVRKDPSAPHEACFLELDITKAKIQLGWRPRLNLDTTIQWVVHWYQAWIENKNIYEYTANQIQEYENLIL